MSERTRKDRRIDKGIPSEADQLRRAAERLDRDGQGLAANLLRNAAFIEENGMEWMEWIRRDGKMDDANVREVKR